MHTKGSFSSSYARLPALLGIGCLPLLMNVTRAETHTRPQPGAATSHGTVAATAHLPGRASTPVDPVALLRTALERCERQVSDYKCVFTKQERMNGKLKKEEAMWPRRPACAASTATSRAASA